MVPEDLVTPMAHRLSLARFTGGNAPPGRAHIALVTAGQPSGHELRFIPSTRVNAFDPGHGAAPTLVLRPCAGSAAGHPDRERRRAHTPSKREGERWRA